MAFALQLKDSLQLRKNQVPAELATGDPLGVVLTRDLLAVEAAADTDMLTSILLLDGSSLTHGAAPNLPPAYCSAIDGVEIGPCRGSCGTAAFLGRPIYVTDIDTDPLWADYRDLALAHGLRACWSTPILDDQAAVIGTFAIYHSTPRAPTADEVKAIRTITHHVARVIICSKRPSNLFNYDAGGRASSKPVLKLVTDDFALPGNQLPPEFPRPIRECPDTAIDAWAHARCDLLLDVASLFEAVTQAIDVGMKAFAADNPDSPDIQGLQRAKTAAQDGAALARHIVAPGKDEY